MGLHVVVVAVLASLAAASLVAGAATGAGPTPVAGPALAAGAATVAGVWDLMPQGPSGANSSTLPLLAPTTLTVVVNATTVAIVRNWTDSSGVSIVVDGVSAAVDGSATRSAVMSRDWPYNVFMGVEYDTRPGAFISAALSLPATALPSKATVTARAPVVTQQRGGDGRADVGQDSTHTVQLVAGTSYLRYDVVLQAPSLAYTFYFRRFRRTSARPLSSVARRATRQARGEEQDAQEHGGRGASAALAAAHAAVPPFNVDLADSWVLQEQGLQQNALVVGLQGLANRRGANLYLTYPPTWAYSYTPSVRMYYASTRNLSFTNVSLAQWPTLVQAFRPLVKGYVVWDPTVRESLVVAYTAAGVEDALVVSPQMVPAARALGLPLVANFSSCFRNMTPTQIYSKAAALYWARCSRETIVWAGGVCGTQIQPGIMDWGVSQRAFFTDLSTRPQDPGYALADKLVGDMAAAKTATPLMLTGWHSYCKDYEHTFTTLASKHGGRVHGLNTNPNLSFSHQIKLPAGYTFRNRPVPPPPPAASFDKVGIVLVQTDGLGLGAWAKPGRGALPYAWEVTLPDLEIQPALLEMFYAQATDKDYFVAALSGPGYMYPKAVPPAVLPARLQLAQAMMRTLDLRHMIVFDASACRGAHTVTGDTFLTPDVVQQYFASMNDTLGFMNGYGPTFTFQHNTSDAHSLISFDYYLDPSRTVADAVQDIEQLAALNNVRPYFLAVHVREFSTVGKVEQIVAALDPDRYEVLPVDTFFQLANQRPTWWPHYQ